MSYSPVYPSSPVPSTLKMYLMEGATPPSRGSGNSAGYDLYSSEETLIPAHGQALIPTGLKMAIPDGYYGRIAPRSGMTVKHMTNVGAGVIDSDYRGEVKVVLFNHSGKELTFPKGTRVAQLIITPYSSPSVKLVQSEDCLTSTPRGNQGFGSSGYF